MKIFSKKLNCIVLFSLFAALSTAQAEQGNSKFIDPKIGSQGAGNTFLGPSMPFGMIKPGPDTGNNSSNSGWDASGSINGFSQTHVSGTGGGAKYGNILVMPTNGGLSVAGISSERENESAKLCHYSVLLKRYNIFAEITTASKAALYRFKFPEGKGSRVVFDAGHLLFNDIAGEGQHLVSSSAQILSPTEVCGHTSVRGGWNKQPVPYTVYFYAASDTPAASFGVFKGGEILKKSKKIEAEGETKTGAWLEFGGENEKTVSVKIGISFVSVEKAKKNAREIKGFDFEKTLLNAVSAWDAALSAVNISAPNEDLAKVFYTSLYHAMLMPSDRSGENPLWKSDEPYYDDFYAIWDTFRTSAPLLALISPKRQSECVRALIDIQRHEGFLPDGRSGNYNGRTQGGSDADIFIADAFAKKLKGVNWLDAYAAVKADAENTPLDHFKEGRGGLDDWKNLGYLSIEGVDRSACKQMEYAYNDYCVALIAKGLGKTKEAELYFKRSAQWQNLWDENLEDGGVKGFIRPRRRDGSWLEPFTPYDGCSWGGNTFYEGNSWTYSLFVPHDIPGLIKKCGGKEAFVKRLDAFFAGPNRCDISNEPFFLSPYLYIWAGRHDKTAERVREIMKHYHASPHGLPGNDDSGALGAWFALSAMGIFPNAGHDYYFIGSPIFEKTEITLGGEK
ncbi:MAG: GH92 family glycosyl hydrolase [Opitutales bacterium]|nr:GH92 family glycosyl hydrolase [Opitutales bacterium]